MIKATNADAEVVLERDVLGRVTKEITNGVAVVSQYDASGNRTHITSGLGADIHASYNLMGDLMSLAHGGWQTQYQRDLFGLETSRTLNGDVRPRTDPHRTGLGVGHTPAENSAQLTHKW